MLKPDGEGWRLGEELTAPAEEAAESCRLPFGQDDHLGYEARLCEDDHGEGPFREGSALAHRSVGTAIQVNA